MTTSTLRRIGVLLGALVLGASVTSPAGARTDEPLGFSRTDPAGDVDVSTDRDLLASEIERVDLLRARYTVVPGRRVTVRLRLADVRGGAYQAFYGLSAKAPGSGESVVAWATWSRVRIIDAEGDVRACRGGRSEIDRKHDQVRFSVPVRCFPGARYRLEPVALLETGRGRDLAFDSIRNPRRVSLR